MTGPRETRDQSGPSDEQLERWFLRRGLPALVDHRSPTARPLHRAATALRLMYVAVIVLLAYELTDNLALDLVWFFVFLLVPWVAVNLFRRRRIHAIPQILGATELAMFVLAPTLIALSTELNGSETTFDTLLLTGIVAALMLAILGVVWLLVGSGIFTLTWWLLRELLQTLNATMAALARTLPLLLGVVTFFFFTAEIWQSVGRTSGLTYTFVLLVFVGLGTLFLGSRRQVDVDELAKFANLEEVRSALFEVDHPFATLAELTTNGGTCPLDRSQRFNLKLVAILSRMVVAVVVAFAVGVVFTVLGILAIDAEVVNAWTLHPPTEIWTQKLGSEQLILSWEHLRVTGFLATFTGFYFSVVSVTDTSLSEGIADTAEEAVRAACAVRLITAGQRSPEVSSPAPTRPLPTV